MKILQIVLFAVCMIVSNCTMSQSNDFESKVDQLVKEYTDLDIFSGVIHVKKGGKDIYRKAFGLANQPKKIKNTLETKFDIGSMTKSFTKVVIAKLISDGSLKKEDHLGKYLKGFKKDIAKNVKVKHLLNHTSGFGDYYTQEYFEEGMVGHNLNYIVGLAKKMELNFPPGSEEMYSNTGYVLLGAIIEKITNGSFGDAVRKYAIEPINLKDTYFDVYTKVPQPRSIGYYKTPLGKLINNLDVIDMPNPSGHMWATTSDILKFYDLYYNTNKLMTSIMKEEFGVTQFVNDIKEDSKGNPCALVSAAGGYNGANTVYLYLPATDIQLVVFANMDEPVAEKIGINIVRMLCGKEMKKPSLPAVQNVYNAYKKHGENYVINNFEDLSENFHPDDPKDMILNMIGYTLMEEGMKDEAIKMFGLNIKIFPEIANCYDSMGEAYYYIGDKTKSLASYQKALKLDPSLPSAIKMVDKIKKELNK